MSQPKEPKKLNILYEDNHLIFVEKSVNIPVQADSSGDEDLQTALKRYIKEKYQKPGEVFLGIAHRLDRPVGGAMVFCKTSKAAARVSEQIRKNEMGKVYLAVVCGNAESGQNTLINYLVKDEKNNMVRTCEEGEKGAKYAELAYKVVGRNGDLSLVSVTLKTGRSHQIRVQMKAAGLPLWGDNRYGSGKPGQQIALWSSRITLIHPTKKEPLTVVSAPPKQHPWSLFV